MLPRTDIADILKEKIDTRLDSEIYFNRFKKKNEILRKYFYSLSEEDKKKIENLDLIRLFIYGLSNIKKPLNINAVDYIFNAEDYWKMKYEMLSNGDTIKSGYDPVDLRSKFEEQYIQRGISPFVHELLKKKVHEKYQDIKTKINVLQN